ncbi:hypothetical protein [Candidatus Hepatoplasma crinochetorum]|uniref:hypothetical protein n=1 Tax=Candidatus Hepatoplasma crinochetorum TaxID=295596 RepID=UPI0030930845|nr:MAG: hypothetical protein HCTKY_0480 [Candidatus Hepatoplasma crinochetorum]
MKNKKILSFIYTIDEKINLEEITRINFFQKYLEDNSLDNLVQIIIYINNYKITKAFNKKITILENEKNLKKTDFLYENLEKIDSKYFKLIKAKDKIIFNWLKNLIYELTNTNVDLIQHSFYKKYKSGEQKYNNKKLNLLTHNTIFKTKKAIKNKKYLLTDIKHFEFQYIGMAFGIDSSWKNINIPYLIYNNILEKIKKGKINQKQKEEYWNDLVILLNFYNKYSNNIDKTFKPNFIKYALNKNFFNTRRQYFKQIKKEIKIKKLKTKIWIFYMIFFKFKWLTF